MNAFVSGLLIEQNVGDNTTLATSRFCFTRDCGCPQHARIDSKGSRSPVAARREFSHILGGPA